KNLLKFIVPESMTARILSVYHDSCAHCGVKKTMQGITSNYWLPSLGKKVQDYIDNCITWPKRQPRRQRIREGELLASETPIPLAVVHVDHFGPLVESHTGFKHVLVAIDALIRFTWLSPVKITGSEEMIENIYLLFLICLAILPRLCPIVQLHLLRSNLPISSVNAT
ncbi:Pro-Pol polyprotein, partial [Trachymyrmex cornetzi]